MRTPRRLGRVSLLAILTMLAGLILASPAHATFPGSNGQIAFGDATTGQPCPQRHGPGPFVELGLQDVNAGTPGSGCYAPARPSSAPFPGGPGCSPWCPPG